MPKVAQIGAGYDTNKKRMWINNIRIRFIEKPPRFPNSVLMNI
jgi:hypothetical protein